MRIDSKRGAQEKKALSPFKALESLEAPSKALETPKLVGGKDSERTPERGGPPKQNPEKEPMDAEVFRPRSHLAP